MRSFSCLRNTISNNPGALFVLAIFMIAIVGIYASLRISEDSATERDRQSLGVPPTTSNNPSTADAVLHRATDAYNQDDVTGAVAILKEASFYNDERISKILAKYKHDGSPKMVKQARDLYRKGEYKQAADLLGNAAEYGNQEAERLVPRYWKRLERAQREEEERQERLTIKADKEKMRKWEGDGNIQIAVLRVLLRHSTESHEANGNNIFVAVYIDALNAGQDIAHVNPNDFTLAAQDGSTVPHDTDTYGLSHYFNAVDLRANQSTSGWLLFYLQRDKRYTLSYQGFKGTAQKTVIP